GSYNELLYRNGNGLLPARLLGKQRAPADGYFHFAVDGQSYLLPPLDAFGDDNDRISLLSARFRQYVRTELAPRGQPRQILSFMPAPTVVRGPASGDANRLPLGDAAIVEWQPRLAPPAGDRGPRTADHARGRVVLVTTPVNMDWGTWPASRSYLPLMQEL